MIVLPLPDAGNHRLFPSRNDIYNIMSRAIIGQRGSLPVRPLGYLNSKKAGGGGTTPLGYPGQRPRRRIPLCPIMALDHVQDLHTDVSLQN